MTIKAIETIYEGCLFRSRLEARWAAFFDMIPWRWTYEPFDLNGYIPDFLIHGERPFLVEVKPFVAISEMKDAFNDRYMTHAQETEYPLLMVGSSPMLDTEHGQSIIGYAKHPFDPRFSEEIVFGTCHFTNEVCATSLYMSYEHRPCGGYDGSWSIDSIFPPVLNRLWNVAHKRTRWTA